MNYWEFQYGGKSYAAQIDITTENTTLKIVQRNPVGSNINFERVIFYKDGENLEDSLYGRVAEYLETSLEEAQKIDFHHF